MFERVVNYRRLSWSKIRQHSAQLFHWLGLLLFLSLVSGPILAIPFDGEPGSIAKGEIGPLILPQGRRLQLLLRSLSLAGAVAIAGTVLGVAVALLLWQWHEPPLSWLRWSILALIALPPYIHALTWSSLVSQSPGTLGAMARGWTASWWVQTMALLPLAIGLALIGFASLDPDLIAAARIYRNDTSCLARIILPLVAPYILASSGLLFVLSLLDYSVPTLFQTNVYALETFAEYSATASASRALMTAAPLLCISLITISLAQSNLRRANVKANWRLSAWQVSPQWPAILRMFLQAAWLIAAMQVTVPLLVLWESIRSLPLLVDTLQAASSEIVFTALTSLLAGCATTILILPVARELSGNGWSAAIWWPVVMAQLAIPPSLVGIGSINLWRRIAPNIVYGRRLMPALAALSRFAPWGALILQAHIRRIDHRLLEAAEVLQTSRLQGFFQVRLPILAPGLVAAFGLVASFTSGELAASLIVAPPGQGTIAMRVYNYLHYGASDAVAGLCLALVLLTLIGGALAALFLGWWSRLYPQRGQP
ncbi:MAG: ABC transporter permease [Chloroflexota bacterium]